MQLAEAKKARKNEQEKDKRKQRQELERIKEAEAQKAHEAALAAIEGRSASELIKAVKPSKADSSRFVPAPTLPCPSCTSNHLFWEATSQKAHEAALAASEARSASKIIKAFKPSASTSNRSAQSWACPAISLS